MCGVDRFTLDTKGGGFERHIKEDHYMWNYLYLVVHLREKDATEYNGWEQHPNPNPNYNPTPNLIISLTLTPTPTPTRLGAARGPLHRTGRDLLHPGQQRHLARRAQGARGDIGEIQGDVGRCRGDSAISLSEHKGREEA